MKCSVHNANYNNYYYTHTTTTTLTIITTTTTTTTTTTITVITVLPDHHCHVVRSRPCLGRGFTLKDIKIEQCETLNQIKQFQAKQMT